VVAINASNGIAAQVHWIFVLTLHQLAARAATADAAVTVGEAATLTPVTTSGSPAPRLPASGLSYWVKIIDGPIRRTVPSSRFLSDDCVTTFFHPSQKPCVR
jgi:hypothetical protein